MENVTEIKKETIRLPYTVFENYEALQSTTRMMLTTKYTHLRSAKRVDKLLKLINEEYQKFNTQRLAIQEECVWETPSTNKISAVFKKQNESQDPVLKNKEEIEGKLKELLKKEAQLDCSPLKEKELKLFKVSPQELGVLEILSDKASFEALLNS